MSKKPKISEQLQEVKGDVDLLKKAVFSSENAHSWIEQQVAELKGQVSVLKKVLYILLTAIIGGIALKLVELSLK